MPQPPPRQSRQSRHVIVSVVGTLLGMVIAGYVAITTWATPFVPMVLMAVIMCPIVLVAVVLGMPEGNNRKLDARSVLPLAAPALIMGVVGMAVAAAWASPGIRVWALRSRVRSGDEAVLSSALRDPSIRVASVACEGNIKLRGDQARDMLLSVLDARPKVAVRCLDALSDSADARAMASLLASRWYHDVMTVSADQAAAACKEIARTTKLRSARASNAANFLTCSLAAVSSRVRQCCAQALENGYGTGASLARIVARAKPTSRILASSLLQASLHQMHMKSADRERARELRLQDPVMQRLAISLACHVLGDDTPTVVSNLAASVAAEPCAMPVGDLDSDSDAWQDICDRVVPMLPQTDQPKQTLCKVARDYRSSQALRVAKQLVHAAIDAYQFAAMDNAIAQGAADQQAAMNSPMGMAKLLKNAMPSGGASGASLARGQWLRNLNGMGSPASARRMIGNVLANTKIPSFGPKQLADGLSKLEHNKKFRDLSPSERRAFQQNLKKYDALEKRAAKADQGGKAEKARQRFQRAMKSLGKK